MSNPTINDLDNIVLALNYAPANLHVRVKLTNIRKRIIDDEPFYLYDISMPLNLDHLLREGDFRFMVDQAALHILSEEVAG